MIHSQNLTTSLSLSSFLGVVPTLLVFLILSVVCLLLLLVLCVLLWTAHTLTMLLQCLSSRVQRFQDNLKSSKSPRLQRLKEHLVWMMSVKLLCQYRLTLLLKYCLNYWDGLRERLRELLLQLKKRLQK